jgi:diacylglycerol kinase
MEILQEIARETLRFCVGLYGLCVVAFVISALNEGLERMVDGLGNKISKIRTAKSLRK